MAAVTVHTMTHNTYKLISADSMKEIQTFDVHSAEYI